MWLMHVKTCQLKVFYTHSPPYAILLQAWGEEEITFHGLVTKGHKHKRGYTKIEGCCHQAGVDGLGYVWVDTCCIDKIGSAELSEAINSIQWYQTSQMCDVHLENVALGDRPFDTGSAFRRSRSFTRGWTLQELLAPRSVCFFDSTWSLLFNLHSATTQETANFTSFERLSKRHLLTDITGILQDVLSGHVRMVSVSVACKFSWAAMRQTQRVEVMAYFLMGLLQVKMPLLCGAGLRVFWRLQEAALSRTDDISALAWGLWTHWKDMEAMGGTAILASSPSAFHN